jgi:hypothetical protein
VRTKLALIIFLLSVTSALGQTVSDFELKYGKPAPVYSVSEHIWMTPEYAGDGQVCRITLFPKHVSGNSTYIGVTLQFWELQNLLNSLVPPNKRGLKTTLNFGATATGGPAAWTTYPYEKVTFTFIVSASKSTDLPLLRKGEFKFSVPATDYVVKRADLAPSANDFLRSESSRTEVVTVQWNDRKCPG